MKLVPNEKGSPKETGETLQGADPWPLATDGCHGKVLRERKNRGGKKFDAESEAIFILSHQLHVWYAQTLCTRIKRSENWLCQNGLRLKFLLSVCTYTHTPQHTHTCMHAHTHTHTTTHAQAHTHTHTYTTPIHKNTHNTHARAHTHTQTHAQHTTTHAHTHTKQKKELMGLSADTAESDSKRTI